MTIPLAAGQTISVMSYQATNLQWSIYGCEIAAGVPQYKCLACNYSAVGAQAWTSIYTVPTGRMALISHLNVLNNAGAAINVYIGTGGNGYLANALWLERYGAVTFDSDGMHVTTGSGGYRYA